MMTEQEVRHAHKELLDQINYIYEVWARYTMQSSIAQRALNGLFEIAKEQDPDNMEAAFRRGVGDPGTK